MNMEIMKNIYLVYFLNKKLCGNSTYDNFFTTLALYHIIYIVYIILYFQPPLFKVVGEIS